MGAPLSITDLLAPPLTVDQAYNSLQAILVKLGIPATSWRKGGTYSSILRVMAWVFSTATTLINGGISAGFLETATGPWLTLLAYYVFNVTRPVATAATGQVTLTNSGAGTFAFGAGQLVFQQVSGATIVASYTNDSAFTLGASSSVTVNVTCTTLGTSGNANAGTVTQLGSPLPNVTCTNAAAIVGQDAMTDADLRIVCSSKLATLSSGGPRGAYVFAVKTALNGGVAVNINRISVSPFSDVGTVTIYLASPSGAPSSGDVAAAVANIEALARPDGVTVNASAASVLSFSRTLTLLSTGAGGVTAAQLQSAALTALTNALSVYPIGGLTNGITTQGYLFAEFVRSLARGADPSIYNVTDGGASDLALSASQVAVGNFTINVTIVPPAAS